MVASESKLPASFIAVIALIQRVQVPRMFAVSGSINLKLLWGTTNMEYRESGPSGNRHGI